MNMKGKLAHVRHGKMLVVIKAQPRVTRFAMSSNTSQARGLFPITIIHPKVGSNDTKEEAPLE
ncbi:hypothetical protein M378DRAFT_171895 [Amanita muscaria Koide BX008]|uniref:Uncharacterized protein n=1 Tax=Amanita muscaria (strain Koide BX008) TaxID=946122 RepID=A0A0C2S3P6_AMAMK|nr:hypothetical protein M378DRAFT_171895 [Amanita muscaria Koide BX008]